MRSAWRRCFPAVLAVLVVALTATAFAQARETAWEIALDLKIPGKGGWMTCYPFAVTLQHRFSQAGGESHLVIYDWISGATHQTYRHAFVVYRDEAGRYWGMDNRSEKPRWLPGTTPSAWADAWERNKKVKLVADYTDPQYAGHAPRPDSAGNS